MALSAGARPKRRSKKVSDPDFVYDFPTDSLFHDALILEQSNPVDPVLFEQSPKSEARSSKSKNRPVTVPGASSPPFVPDVDTNPSLSFDQQLQLIKLQKEKLELEVKVLAMSRQERPLENSFADLSTRNARDAIAPGHTKRNIDWPQDFVPSIQGEYDKLELPEFVSGFLIMIKTYDSSLKDAMLAHLELLLTKAISYSWISVRGFHKFIAKQVEQRRSEWQDFKSIQDQATTFFRHSDLRNTRQRIDNPRQPSHNASSGDRQQAVPPTVKKACKTWNYTGSCDCDPQDEVNYKEHHRCRVCKADHPMLHCSKRRTPIPPQ